MMHRLACATVIALSAPATLFAQDTDTSAQAPAATEAPAASDVTSETVVARVGDTEITVGHVLTARASLPQDYAQLPASMLFPGLVDQLVNQELLEQAYSGEVPRAVAVSIENSQRSLMAAVSLADHLETAITPDMLQSAYNDAYGDGFEPVPEYHAAHVLVDSEERAREIIAQYEDGVEFAKLARDNSDGPSAPNGGDLGWMTAGQTVQPFNDAMIALEPGAISEPVQSDFGWHVIKLYDTRTEAPALAEVEDQLRAQMQEQVTTDYIDELLANGDVDTSGSEGIDPSVLDTITIVE